MQHKKKHDPSARQKGAKAKGKAPGAIKQNPKDMRKSGAEGNTLLDAVRSLKKVKR